nr:uncharacterized protein LOC115269108 [Aedes albopictus]
MKIIRFRNVVSSLGGTISSVLREQEAAYNALQSKLEEHTEQIAQLTNRFGLQPPSLPTEVQSLPAPSRSRKRRRTDDDPKPSKPLLGGTKVTDEVFVATVPQPTATFWIYLSRLHPSVKSDAVEKVTRECLNCEDVRAIPLIKRGTDVNTLNFVSFKVGVDPKYRTAALDPSTWPRGILFREFEDNRSSNYWMPDTDPQTPTIVVSPDFDATPSPQATRSMDTTEC